MKKVVAEKYRDIDFSKARRGAVIPPESGKRKISIRLDNAVLDYFLAYVDKAGGGNYQTMINDVLRDFIRGQSTAEVLRQVVREELAHYDAERKPRVAAKKVRPRRG